MGEHDEVDVERSDGCRGIVSSRRFPAPGSLSLGSLVFRLMKGGGRGEVGGI